MSLIEQWREDTDKSMLKNFLSELKTEEINQSNLDRIVHDISKQVTEKIDCLECANCCKTSVTTFENSDISKASKYLGVSKKAFIRKYLILDPQNDTFITMNTPCPMLNADNTCKIYSVRPKVCDSYPHTSRSMFKNRIHAHIENTEMCPITYHVVKALRDVQN